MSHVGHKHSGLPLLNYLTQRFTYFSADEWRQRIEVGELLLNDGQPDPAHPIKLGDKVAYFATLRPEPKTPKKIPVLFEDEDLLIVNKPPHLPVHPGGKYLRNTLISQVTKARNLDFLVLSHRLDRETSGLCVMSKTRLAKDKMYWAFFNGEVEKTYWALCWGRPPQDSGTVDLRIGPAKPGQSRIRIKQVENGLDAKESRTKYRTLKTFSITGNAWAPPPWPSLKNRSESDPLTISLVECRPITGRTNQIRVHMAHLGCGIVGDKLYDPDESVFIDFKDQDFMPNSDASRLFVRIPPHLAPRLVLDAHALHAKTLRFRHPRTGKMLQLHAPIPENWKRVAPIGS